ncbi:MAG: PQQ-binding-like beta-propeller repeat protein [Gemmataceae bacterium]|nr:PQQ-binding-like beta-propeller repeat protein [Gemmataceae bacterium]
MHRLMLTVGLSLLSLPLSAADWAQFKGPNAAGVSDEKGLPVEWGKDKGVKWKTALPARGVSCPVVVGNRVYVTCASGKRDDKLHVLAYDATTGKELWHRQLLATGPTSCHPMSSMAAPTPVADETGVYALFASGDVAAFDADGTLRWYRSLVGDYPTITNQVGMAASPVLVGDRLIVPMDNDGESFLAAVDTRYGKNVWKADRPKAINWVTPLVREAGGTTEVLFAGPGGMTAYDAATGKQRWVYKEAKGDIPTASIAGGFLYYPAGGVAAVKLGEKGAEEKPAMTARTARPGMASPLVYMGKVFTVDGQGFVTAADAKTGKQLYKERTKGAASASPVAGDGKVYVTSEKGVTTVLPADKETFEPLATNDLGEEVLGTPAISGGSLFIRTDKHLYRIGK